MLEMLMKQMLGDIDLDSVKLQVQQFAQLIAESHKLLKENNAILRRIELRQTSQEATLLQGKGTSNDHDDDHDQRPGIEPEQPIA